jgi:hypothetical protein
MSQNTAYVHAAPDDRRSPYVKDQPHRYPFMAIAART